MKPQLPATIEVTPWRLDGRGQRVPEQLGVVVGVGVDEARAHHEAGGVDGVAGVLAGQAAGVGDGHDAATRHADVGGTAGSAGAVDQRAAADDEIEHVRVPCGRAI